MADLRFILGEDWQVKPVATAASAPPVWTPDTIFAEVGATKVFWADFTTCQMWQDAGKTTIAGIGDPVGAVENQSKIGGIEFSQATSNNKANKHADGLYRASSAITFYNPSTSLLGNEYTVGAGRISGSSTTGLTGATDTRAAAYVGFNSDRVQFIYNGVNIVFGTAPVKSGVLTKIDGTWTGVANTDETMTMSPIDITAPLHPCIGYAYASQVYLNVSRFAIANKMLTLVEAKRLAQWLATGL